MALVQPYLPDLKVEHISNPTVDKVLAKLSDWVTYSAQFTTDLENLQRCVDKDFAEVVQPLLDALGLPEKVWN